MTDKIIIHMEVNKSFPEYEKIKELQNTLCLLESVYIQAQGRKILEGILNDHSVPTSLKAYIAEKQITSIEFERLVLSKEWMPTNGTLLKFVNDKNIDMGMFFMEGDEEFCDLCTDVIQDEKHYAKLFNVAETDAKECFRYLKTIFQSQCNSKILITE